MTPSRTARVLAGILALGLLTTACANPESSAPSSTRPVDLLVDSTGEASWDQPAPLPLAKPAVRFMRSSINADRFAIVCEDDVVLSASPGWHHIAQTTSTGVSVSQDTLEATLPSGQLLHQLELRSGASTRVLSIQCLPADFPVVTMSGRFSSPVLLTAGPPLRPRSMGFRLLLDRDGFPLWFDQAVPVFGDLALQDDGVLQHSGTSRPLITYDNIDGQGFQIADSSGRVLRSWVPDDGTGLDFHTGQLLPNGNLLAIRYIPGPTPQKATMVSGLDQGEFTCQTRPMRDFEGALYGQVVEVTPQGVVARSWSLDDVLPDAAVSPQAVFIEPSAIDKQSHCLVDLHHLNSAVFYPTPGASAGHGRVLVTGRHINGAVLLDWPSGEVLWTIGGHAGPQALRVTDDPLGGPFRPHDATLVFDRDVDRLLLYDNRDVGEPSRAAVYRIDRETSTATLEATYTTDCGTPPIVPQGRTGTPASTDTTYSTDTTATTEVTKGLCAAFVMGSARALPGDRGLLVGWGAAVVTASEFAWGAASPRAQLSLGGLWSYRVVPVTESDVARFLYR